MKKTSYILPAIALLMLSACYDSGYVLEDRIVGELTTQPAKIDETGKTLSLVGDGGDMGIANLYFQLSRTRDFTNGELLNVNYQDGQGIPLGMFSGTYYYRLFTALEGDTVFAPNVETFNVDNTLTIIAAKPDDVTTYNLICNSNNAATTYFRVSTDKDFNDFEDYYAMEDGHNQSMTSFDYSVKVEKLSRGTTYYFKAVRDVILGKAESEVSSFTTQDILRMGEVTYTGWDGKSHPMIDGYDFFRANYMLNGEVIGRDLEVYYSPEGWKISKEIIPNGNGVLYGYLSYDEISNDEILIQTYKYNTPTLMWGVAEERNGVFNINLQNMLSRVVFHLTVADDYPVDKPEVNEFIIDGNTLPTQANFQVINGQFVYNQWSFSEPLGYWNRIPLCKGETVDVVIYSIPCESGKATATLKFEDRKSDSDIEIGWKSGNTYEYNLQVTATGLSISDVIVNQWQPTEGGSITINP